MCKKLKVLSMRVIKLNFVEYGNHSVSFNMYPMIVAQDVNYLKRYKNLKTKTLIMKDS